MNKKVQELIRGDIKSNIGLLSEEQELVFRKLHAGGNTMASIYDIIDNIPADKLESAMDLVDRTLAKGRRTK